MSSRGLAGSRRLSRGDSSPEPSWEGLGTEARRPSAGGAGVQSHSASPPARSRPRSAPPTPPPARCRRGNSVFRRFRPRAPGRRTGPRNFPKWRARGRVRRPPAPLWLPPRRRPRYSRRPALRGAPRGPGPARVRAAAGPGPRPRLCCPAAPHGRGPRPRPHPGA